jgi:predicted nucleotide-binding protein
MHKDEVVSGLRAAGLTVVSEQRNKNGTAAVIRLDTGAIVHCWDNGNVTFQGKNQDAASNALGIAVAPASGGLPTPALVSAVRKVFVVYGHDTQA